MGTNTSIGIGIGIPFKNNALGGDRPYLPPELKARLIGVWDNYGKKNTDADRNIIKNKIPNAGGDLEILNSAYRLNSGFGGYSNDFQEYTYSENVVVKDNTNAIFNSRGKLLVPYSYLTKDIPSFKIKVSGLSNTYHFRYYYRDSNGVQHSVDMAKDGNYELPICYNVQSSSDGTSCGFTNYGSDIVSVEILPEYEGAFVTDGVDDMIISQKTLQEMGITDEVTVVSMIHQIDLNSTYTIATTNYIENSNSGEHVRSDVYNYGKTGIYGYSASLINNTKSDIKNILGDEADYYVKSTNSLQTIFDAKFSVVGRISELTEASQVAWYWTIIAKRLLTTDEINQVIAYYNLDKYVKPDVYYDVKKQGLTNENHAEFNDKLIDYSGNGRDLQLFNIGWKGESGIGRYTEEFKNDYWLVHKDQTGIIKDGNSIKVVGKLSNYYIVYHSRLKATNGFKVKIKGIKTEIIYNYISSDKEQSISFKEDGIYDIPASEAVDSTFTLGFYFRYDDINLDWTGLTIEIIPSNKGALCLDGINDFGKVINMPIYKDYTFIVDREILSIDNIGIIASKSESAEDGTKYGAFIFEYLTAPNIINTWSYYKNNINIANTDFIRGISYQSKYNYNGKDLIIGTSKDSDKLYLGTIRDNSDKYGNIAIYFLMSFPYSMNKFLIERQLKKYKAGTLYKDMVEFRPVIKSNIDIKNIVYLDKDSNVVKVGDYISIGSNIKTSITVLDGYKISKVSSTAFNNITIEKSNTDFIYDVIFYGIKKSPQKINLVIEQDSDYVQWNPNIKANVSKYSVTANIRKTDGTTLKLVNGQFYSTSITGNLVLDIVPPYKDSDEVTNVVIDGKSYVPTKDSSGNYYRLEIPLVFPKEINITIQEYVRYEDIVQPYPVLLRFKDENGNEISWGDKIKLGSSITRIGSFNDCNLLKDIYTVSNAKLNGSPLPNTPHVVERQMIFTCTATWIFDNNEPKCVLSPRLLRVPNSSYKILGYIPDISGHGNHGVIHNSAYAEGSGVNEDGSYQLDGVDDFVTIPTIVGGKQVLMKVNWQNRTGLLYDQRKNGSSIDAFAILNVNSNNSIAYNSRNTDGETYIDGILNKNIVCPQLYKITHSITIINQLANKEEVISPTIGSDTTHKIYFSQMSLYDFMLFDDISTEDKIKELNEYVGIEAKVELPPYYWDAYGKTNLDADKATIQQRGVAVGDYDLTNTNFAYDKMSGFGGYEFEKFTDTTKWIETKREDGIEVIEKNDYSFTAKKVGTGQYFWDFKNNSIKTLDRDLTVKAISNNNVYIRWEFKYRTAKKPDIDSTIILLRQAMTPNVPITVTLPYKTQEEQTELGVVEGSAYYLFYFDPSDIPVGDEYTVEMLPLYTNGLVYDGVTDYSENTNIPALTDYTYVFKRELLNLDKVGGGASLYKGSFYSNGGRAFIVDINDKNPNSEMSGYSYGNRASTSTLKTNKIIYGTKTSVNGVSVTPGSNTDNASLTLGKWDVNYKQMVFYKLILYPKTIPLLQINFLKNLMEKDEIIDINHPIFISNTEDESNTSQDT